MSSYFDKYNNTPEMLEKINNWLIQTNTHNGFTNCHILVHLYNTILDQCNRKKVCVNENILYQDLVYLLYSKNLEHTH